MDILGCKVARLVDALSSCSVRDRAPSQASGIWRAVISLPALGRWHWRGMMSSSRVLAVMGMVALLAGCHGMRGALADDCCASLDDIVASPTSYGGKTVTLRGRMIYDGYLYLDASTQRDGWPSPRGIEVSEEEVVGMLSDDEFFELDGACMLVRGEFQPATEHPWERVGRISGITRLEAVDGCERE